jgi:hypothetical protein
MSVKPPDAPNVRFRDFYRGPYLEEHRHPATVSLHVLGTLAGLAILIGSLMSPFPYLAILFPVVHATPGLLGHRLFERNRDIGDVRILRKDYPKIWFMIANHILVLDLLRGGPHRTVRVEIQSE